MLKQTLSQKLLQKLSPQQIMYVKLLQLSTVDFEERVEQELLDNPALEDDIEGDNNENLTKNKETTKQDEFDNRDSLNEDYNGDDLYSNDDYSSEDFQNDEYDSENLFKSNDDYNEDLKETPLAYEQSFYDYLSEQIRANYEKEEDITIALNIVGNIEEDGYLRRELKAIVNDLAFNENIFTTLEKLEEILKVIQEFDPPGIGARNLQECLLLQLDKKDQNSPAIKLAKTIIKEHFELFKKKHYDKIRKPLKITEEDLKLAIAEIVKLNPQPGQTYSASVNQYIIPDFTVLNEEGKLKVILNSKNCPDLKISPSYSETLKAYEADNNNNKTLKDSAQYIRQKLEGAKWFIDSVRQRQLTLNLTMNAIVEQQKEFFLEGDETNLKPMVLKDIADIIKMDVSTVSRVVNSKWVETEFGTFSLKHFFSEGIANEHGEEVSNKEVKKILTEAVDNEDKQNPLNDEELMEILKEKGYNIARRTVAKYREQLNIPVGRLRREI